MINLNSMKLTKSITRTMSDGVLYGGIFVAQQDDEDFSMGDRFLECSRRTDKAAKLEMVLAGVDVTPVYHYKILLEEAPPKVQKEFTQF